MVTNMEKIIARLLFVPITGFFAFLLFTQFGKSLNDLIYNLTEDNYLIFLRFDTRDTVIFWITVSWIIAHIIFEIVAHLYKDFKCKRLLAHLRYSPITILVVSVFAIQAYDVGMITYSKQQIRNYIYDDAQLIIEPDIILHNNYRHWCGNGASAQENYLYFDTASEGMNNTNPYVRARSLLMADEVQDWINGGDKRFDNYLANSCRDSDTIVQNVAEGLLNKSESSCEKSLLKR
jgi:hypothetical protein